MRKLARRRLRCRLGTYWVDARYISGLDQAYISFLTLPLRKSSVFAKFLLLKSSRASRLDYLERNVCSAGQTLAEPRNGTDLYNPNNSPKNSHLDGQRITKRGITTLNNQTHHSKK